MNIGIVGLGLIGASFAKAYKANSNHRILGFDTDKSSLSYAKLSETIDETLCDENIGECDLIIIALYPKSTVEFVKNNAKLIKSGAIVMDTCGTKTMVCSECFKIAEKHDFTFLGAHPMAGVQFSGIKYSRADMFKNASMIIVPPMFDDIDMLEKIKKLLLPLELGKITVSTAENHDKIIAYTSQLAHIVSSAYAKSDTALLHHGFSAGSYRDMTRVATLNEIMWSELFLENKENLSNEVGKLIAELEAYKSALDSCDNKLLTKLLREGKDCKEHADG